MGRALPTDRALLPADLLVQFEPWKSQVAERPQAEWDALVWDGIAQYYPWRLFASESIRAGRIPLWNPYQFCGTPFLANGQSAVFYPLNLLYWLLPVARAFAVSAWLHLLLAGWFSYLYLRRINLGRLGALCGGLAWQLNSFFIAWLHLPTVICTAAWLPLILLFLERALVSGCVRYAIAAGVALAVSYLGGHPQVFLLTALLSVTYLVARGVAQIPVGQELTSAAFSARALNLTKIGFITGAFAVGLASVQLLPTLDLLSIAHRAFTPGPESYRAFLSRPLPLPLLSGLVLPHPYGHPALGTYLGPENYAEYCCYTGIVAFSLALYGAFASRAWHTRFFSAAIVLAIMVAVGTPLNWPLYHWVPGMSGAGGPARTILLAVFSLSMLAGIGVDQLSKSEAPPRIAVIPLALVVTAAILWWQLGGPVLSRAMPALASELTAEAIRAVVLVVISVVLLLCLWRPRVRGAAQAALAVILAADLLLAAQRHVHIVPVGWVYSRQAAPGEVGGRVLGNAADWPINRFPRAVFPPNAATVYHLRDVYGYDSLYLARYRDFASLIQGADPSPPLNGNLLLARLGPVYGLDMISLAGVKRVLSPVPVRGLRLERAGVFDTYVNPYQRPRAWVAESAVAVRTHVEAVAALAKLGGFEEYLIITGVDEPLIESLPGQHSTAKVRDSSPNEVVVELPGGGGGFLFLADSFSPGWHAYADGHELPIRIANVAFRAVAPPVTARSVIFRYQPAAFQVGLFATSIGVSALFLTSAFRFMVTLHRHEKDRAD